MQSDLSSDSSPLIKVLINHEPYNLKLGVTLAQAIQICGVTPPFAAAVNLDFVPKSDYDSKVLFENDSVELISPITGG